MMEKRLLKMEEAVETGVDDSSTGPSGISGGDTVKMHHYIN
jgi:L-serine dehydratase